MTPARFVHRDDRDHEQSAAWGKVREACADALARYPVGPAVTERQGAYTVASGGRVHVVATMQALADATRWERRRWGVEWPEDPGARPTRRGD